MVKRITKLLENPIWFKLIYFALVLLSFNSLCALTPGVSYASYVVALLGGVVFLFRVVHYKKYISTRGIIWLILFCGSYCLSALLTRQYGLLENAQALVWTVIQFFIIYTYDKEQKVAHDKKEIKIIGWFFIGYTFLMSVTAIVMLILDYNLYKPIGDTAVISGFLWNRLWGLYTDPNYGAVFCIVSMVLAITFFKTASKGIRAFLGIHIAFQVLYIAFSDSRTGIVSLAVTVLAGAFLLLLRCKKFENYHEAVKCIVSLVLAFVLAFASVAAVALVQKGGSQFKEIQYKIQAQHNKLPDDDLSDYLIGRTDSDINNDVSNRRFAIWTSGLEIFKTSPLTGITFRNYIPYAKQNLPETYIVNNDSGDFASMHNSFVDVLVSQGVLGMVILLCFIVSIVIAVLKFFFKASAEDYQYNTFLLLCFLPVFVSMMFYSETFYMNTGGAFIFWSFLGYLMHSLTASQADHKLIAKIKKEK